MLKRFEVEGFKNFNKKIILDFSDVRDYHFNEDCIRDGLLNNAIIYGKNATGKTNFGNAILDIKSNFLRNDISDIFRSEFDESYLNADSDQGFAEFFYIFKFGKSEVSYRYKKISTFEIISEQLFINDNLIFDYDNKNKKMLSENLSEIKADKLNWQAVDNYFCVLNYVINNAPLASDDILSLLMKFIRGMRGISGNRLGEYELSRNRTFKELIANKRIDEFERFLNEFGVHEKIEVLTSPSGEEVLYFKHQNHPIPFYENCSSGTRALINLFTIYDNSENFTFLYLDEFDAFYHYFLSEKVFKFFGKLAHCQTIATSHNTDLLSNKIMRPDCFFVLTHDRLTAIVNATKRELREGHNLEKLYKSGEFDNENSIDSRRKKD